MKCLHGLIVVLTLGLAMPVGATPADVRAGEHNGFTRFVVPLAAVKEWDVTHRGNQIVLTYEDYLDGFETADLFQPIRKDRVSEVTAEEDRLTFQLDCDCRVSAFVARGAFVVLDVADPDTRLPTPLIEHLAALPEEEPAAVPLLPAEIPPTETAQAETAPEPIEVPQVSLTTAPPRVTRLDRALLNSAEQEILSDMRRKLATELGEAATRGVLQAAPGPHQSLPRASRPQIDTAAFGDVPPAAEPRPEPMLDQRTNIRITTSADMPFNLDPDNALTSISGTVCPKPAVLDLISWGDDRPFDQQIREARTGLFGEFDKLDRKVALRLSRLYLHFGFGIEARRTLELDPELARKHALLLEISDIMDGKMPTPDGPLARFADCDSDAALWGVLALGTQPRASPPDIDAALRALDRLPLHLREFLTPELSRKLLELGDKSAANTALRNLERVESALPSAAKLAKAEVALDAGHADEAKTQLEDVIDDNSEYSPEALIKLVDAHIESGEPISADVSRLVEAYAQELRGKPMGAEMLRAHTQALVKSGQFDRAFLETTAFQPGGSQNTERTLRTFMLRELTSAADDVTFLNHVFAHAGKEFAELPAQDALSLARRLLDLGFATKADQIVSLLPERPRNTQRQMLLARAALLGEKPFRAQAALIGITTPQADLLRAESNRMAGAHAKAHDYYVQANEPESAAEVAWLAEDWRRLTDSETPVFGPTSTLQAPDATPAVSTEGMLARSESVLEESAAARRTLSELLGAVPVDEISEN